MTKVSIRQPVVLYAVVFMVFTAFLVLTLASFSLVNASRRAYRRAVERRLHSTARLPDDALDAQIKLQLPEQELDLGIVTATTTAFGLDLGKARALVARAQIQSPLVAVRMGSAQERYLIARLRPSVTSSIAFVEISRMLPFVLLGAFACAAILAFMLNRLLVPPLNALAQVAQATRPAEAGLVPSDAPNEILEVARRFRDTVRQLNEERELVERQKKELEQMQSGLVRASKLASVGRLAAGIAHEIGNPLAAVQGYLSLLKRGLPETQREEVLDRSLKELQRIHETIKMLLTYARGGEDKGEATTTFQVQAIIQDALTLVKSHPALLNTQVLPPQDTEALQAVGHAQRLEQVLVNLLLNAAQAMKSTEAPKIELSIEALEQDSHLVRIRVRDNGPGVAPDHAQQIFDPFFTTKDPGEGTGLGLAVSRALMEAMNGDLVLASEEESEEGACFDVLLQRARIPSP